MLDRTVATAAGGVFACALVYALARTCPPATPAWVLGVAASAALALSFVMYGHANTEYALSEKECGGETGSPDPVESADPFRFYAGAGPKRAPSVGPAAPCLRTCERHRLLYGLYHSQWHLLSGAGMCLCCAAVALASRPR